MDAGFLDAGALDFLDGYIARRLNQMVSLLISMLNNF